jgi:hypothetical protein
MRLIKGSIVLLLGILSAAYLANIGAGVVELVPDNIPLLGNIDEAGATLLLLNCLAYFGINLGRSPTTPDYMKSNESGPRE